MHFCIFKYEKIFFKPGSCNSIWSHIHKSWNVLTCECLDHLTHSIWQWFQFCITCQGCCSLRTNEGHEGTNHWWVMNFCDLNILQFLLDCVTQMFDSIWYSGMWTILHDPLCSGSCIEHACSFHQLNLALFCWMELHFMVDCLLSLSLYEWQPPLVSYVCMLSSVSWCNECML